MQDDICWCTQAQAIPLVCLRENQITTKLRLSRTRCQNMAGLTWKGLQLDACRPQRQLQTLSRVRTSRRRSALQSTHSCVLLSWPVPLLRGRLSIHFAAATMHAPAPELSWESPDYWYVGALQGLWQHKGMHRSPRAPWHQGKPCGTSILELLRPPPSSRLSTP